MVSKKNERQNNTKQFSYIFLFHFVAEPKTLPTAVALSACILERTFEWKFFSMNNDHYSNKRKSFTKISFIRSNRFIYLFHKTSPL